MLPPERRRLRGDPAAGCWRGRRAGSNWCGGSARRRRGCRSGSGGRRTTAHHRAAILADRLSAAPARAAARDRRSGAAPARPRSRRSALAEALPAGCRAHERRARVDAIFARRRRRRHAVQPLHPEPRSAGCRRPTPTDLDADRRPRPDLSCCSGSETSAERDEGIGPARSGMKISLPSEVRRGYESKACDLRELARRFGRSAEAGPARAVLARAARLRG